MNQNKNQRLTRFIREQIKNEYTSSGNNREILLMLIRLDFTKYHIYQEILSLLSKA